MLRNRPIRLGVGYFVNNLKRRKTSRLDDELVGFLKRKLRATIGENGESIVEDVREWVCVCGWVGGRGGGGLRTDKLRMGFRTLMASYQEPDGSPIVRIAKQLGGPGEVIRRELEVGAMAGGPKSGRCFGSVRGNEDPWGTCVAI